MADDASCDLDDETIVLRMMDGDNDALRQLRELMHPRPAAYLRRKLGEVLADPEIDEAMNVAAFNAFRFADRFDQAQRNSLNVVYDHRYPSGPGHHPQ